MRTQEFTDHDNFSRAAKLFDKIASVDLRMLQNSLLNMKN